MQNFTTFSKNQLDSFVDLEKPEKMRIWLQNFVSIQPRTSLEKSDVSWPKMLETNNLAVRRRLDRQLGSQPEDGMAAAAKVEHSLNLQFINFVLKNE